MSWIFESIKKSKKMKDHYVMHDINIFIKDSLPDGIDVDFILKYISQRIPSYLMRGVDMIYIGQFKQLKEREVNALFEDGAIYLTNEQDDDKDMIDDIVHEIAHSIEHLYGDRIYDDNLLVREFLGKRKRISLDLANYSYNLPKNYNTKLNSRKK